MNRLYLNFALLIVFLGLVLVHLFLPSGTLLPAYSTNLTTYGQFLSPTERATYRTPATYASDTAHLAGTLSAEGVLVLDVSSKQVLFAKNPDLTLYPASTTKIITALVTRDQYPLSATVGQGTSVDDLLTALLIASDNEAALTLASSSPVGYDGFIAAMNAKATSLGLTASNFVNPAGFDHSEQKTTVSDLALASLELLRYPQFRALVASPSATIPSAGGTSSPRFLRNTNQLLTRTDLPFTVLGVKTGTTSLAHEALVSLLARDGHEVLVVVLSAKNRYNDTINIANFIFNNFLWQQPPPKSLL